MSTTTVTMTAPCMSSTTNSLLLTPPTTEAAPFNTNTTDIQRPPPSQEKQSVPRLLYRGAFSLPDSNLLLDGLTFIINLPADDPQASFKLLETPLPLALESMRGRPSLRFIGVEKMNDLYCDFSGGVTVHIHPRCILTYQLFAHNLCMEPITSPTGCTDLGIRVRLGDSDSNYSSYSTSSSSDLTDIIIYGRTHPSTSIMQLCVARIMPLPPPVPKPIARLRPPPPRPDDPTPRRPPVGFGRFGMTRIGLGVGVKRPISAVKKDEDGADMDRNKDKEGGPRKRARKDEGGEKQAAGRSGSVQGGKPVFKVPPLPPPKRDRPLVRAKERTKPAITSTNEDALPAADGDGDEAGSELEKSNKVLVKKAVVRQMATIGISKQHPDFKDFFGHVYRGVSFALRAKLNSSQLDKDPALIQRMERLVQSHVDMYIEERDSGVDC